MPDVPEEVTIQNQRAEFINLKVIECVEDEDYGIEYDKEEDNDDEGGDAAVSGNPLEKFGGCCSFKIKGQKKNKKISKDLNEFPTFNYPFSHVPSQWPEALDKNSKEISSILRTTSTSGSVKKQGDSSSKESAAQPASYVDYTSNLSAVQSAENQGMNDNPAAYY